MKRTQEVIGTCDSCGARVVWMPLFGASRDLGACEKCSEWRYMVTPRNDSAPAGSGEVEIAGAPKHWGDVMRELEAAAPEELKDLVFEVSYACDQRLSFLALRVRELEALLRKLQQGADYVMVPREPTQAMRAAGERERMSHPGNINPLTTWDAMIAASQGQEGGK